MAAPIEYRFECQPGCTKCCEQSGFVWLTDADVERLAAFLNLGVAEFEKKYVYRTRHQARLRVPKESTCCFLTAEGCSVHPAKPTQCRTFPFWPELVEDRRAWRKTARWCPGIGKGDLVPVESIQKATGEMREGYPRQYRP